MRPRPPVKWAGGKGGLIPQFEPLFPKRPWDLYIEPFVGGGAVFFHLASSLFFHLGPTRAVLIDKNEELINFYKVLRDNLEELLADLRRHEMTPEYYYRIRALNPEELTPVQRASRFLYLNRAGYRGLWRLNSKGQNNVAFGWKKNSKVVNETNLRLVSRILARPEILLLHGDYSLALDYARPGTFVYLDPPYYRPKTARNAIYTSDGFDVADQIRLAKVFRELDRRGCLLMMSNSDTPFIRQLYAGYDIRVVYTKYPINRFENRRAQITELVIRNYS